MSTLWVMPCWPSELKRDGAEAFASLQTKLTARHFDRVVLCMPEVRGHLRHDFTLEDLIGRYRTRLHPTGEIVLSWEAPETFFKRRPQ